MGYLAYYFLGKVYRAQKELEKARESFEYCLEIEPGFKDAKEELKVVEIDLKQSGYPDETNFSCETCGNCCRTKLINISHKDIKNILKNRPDLKPDDFLKIMPINKAFLPDKYEKEFFISAGNKRHWLVLEKKENSNDCIFLTDNNYCSIHEFKPLACKVWPFSLRQTDNKIVWSKNDRDFIAQYCAHTIKNNANDPEEIKMDLEKYTNERKEYYEVISKWNKQASDSVFGEQFWNFILSDSN
mgnify:CR=1 FL=1